MRASPPACTTLVIVSVAVEREGAPTQVRSMGRAGFGNALGEKRA